MEFKEIYYLAAPQDGIRGFHYSHWNLWASIRIFRILDKIQQWKLFCIHAQSELEYG